MDWSDVILQVFFGIILADIISGVVHWFEDTYGDPKWPVIGKPVIEPNIIHHDDPLKFTRAPLWKRSRAVIPLALAFLGVFWLLDWLNVFTVTAVIVGAMANETHRWAHLPPANVPRLVRMLQHVGLIQSAQHHWRHHRHGFNTHYCAITNIANPVLDGLHVFRFLEGVLEGLFAVKPRHDRAHHDHPTLGRRWIAKSRRLVCAGAYQTRRALRWRPCDLWAGA